MKYNLFLDDYRVPAQVTWAPLPRNDVPWIVAKDFREFMSIVEEYGLPEFIAYDHDLADVHYSGDYSTEYTGYHAASWMLEWCAVNDHKHPPYVVHSMNPVGAARIKSLLESFT